MKKQLKRQIETLISGDGDDRQRTAIFIKKPDGSLILYGAWPPIQGLKPGDPVPEDHSRVDQRLNVTADSEATAETFKKIRGLTT